MVEAFVLSESNNFQLNQVQQKNGRDTSEFQAPFWGIDNLHMFMYTDENVDHVDHVDQGDQVNVELTLHMYLLIYADDSRCLFFFGTMPPFY